MQVLRMAAFTDTPEGGNPAGVVIDDVHPDEATMQRVAAEVGYSETAFLHPLGPSSDGTPRYRVRYFTPTAEVPFCGHATIAAAVVLGARDGLGRRFFELNNAIVPVEVAAASPNAPDGLLRAALVSPAVSVAEVPDDVLDQALTWLRWDRADLDPELPPRSANAGSGHLILALREPWHLDDLRYDEERLAALCREQGWITVHCTWAESAIRYHARDAAPAVGIFEDPATGAAAAAFGGYLRHIGMLEPPATFTIRQGEAMGRPSELTVTLDPDDPGVRVSGTAVAIPTPSPEPGEAN